MQTTQKEINMKIQTVNQLISVFKDISTRHYQINGFGIGDDWENGASEAKMHPVLWINPTTANMPASDNGYKTFEIDFEVRVFDLVNKDESNENEVLSDCIDILKDIITEFKGHPYYVNSQLNIIDDIGFEAFTEEFDEEVSGWVCEISLMTPILNSFCGIPAADITGFEFPGTDCPDVNVLCPVFVEDVTGVSPIVVTTIGTTKQISLDGGVGSDVFVVSGSYNTGTSNLELLRNDGVTVLADLSSINTTDTHLTSAVYDNSTTTLDLTLTDGTVFNVDLSALKDDTNTHLTNLVFNASNDNNLVATLNDGTIINSLIDNFDDLTVNGDVNATNFIGDGSQLTNLPSSGGGGIDNVTSAEKAALTPSAGDFVFDTDLNSLQRYNGVTWIDVAKGFGAVGIGDANGVYEFFTDYASAISVATSGQTIEQFGDIVETGNVTVTIPSDVNINMNGYTYTLDGSNNNAFKKVGSDRTKIVNGSIIKINSPLQTTGGGYGLEIIGTSEVDCSGLIVNSDGEGSVNFNTTGPGQGVIIQGTFYYTGTSALYTFFAEGKMVKSFIDTGAGSLRCSGELYDCIIFGSVFSNTGALYKNCTIYNENSNIGLLVGNAKAYNCDVYSLSTTAIDVTHQNAEVHDCTGTSDGGFGIDLDKGTAIGCSGVSNSTKGLFVNQSTANAHDCVGKSSVSSGIELRVGNLYNCTGISTFNDASGHGIYVGNNNGVIMDCTGITTNASAHAVQGGPVNRNSYIVNLKGEGMTTLIGSKSVNIQTNLPDAFNNILIG